MTENIEYKRLWALLSEQVGGPEGCRVWGAQRQLQRVEATQGEQPHFFFGKGPQCSGPTIHLALHLHPTPASGGAQICNTSWNIALKQLLLPMQNEKPQEPFPLSVIMEVNRLLSAAPRPHVPKDKPGSPQIKDCGCVEVVTKAGSFVSLDSVAKMWCLRRWQRPRGPAPGLSPL